MKRLLSILSLLLLCVGGISAQTSVSIDMTNAIVDESSYLCTYSSEQNLDFSGIDGIKAYVATKNHDKYGAVVSVTLKPIATVPSGTGVVLKAEAARSYTVPTIDLTTPEELKNDLIAALADVDLHEAVKRNTWGDFTSGAIGLAKGIITTGYDENWNPIFGQAIGFFTYPRTYAAGESFIKAGDAYLNIADGEWDSYGEGYVKLEFADAAVAEYNGIGQLLAIPVLQDAESTPAKLNLQHTCTVNWTDGKYALVSDPSGAVMLQVPEGVSMKAGDMLSGTYTGNYNNMLFPQLLVSAITNAADLTVLDGTDEPQAKKATLEEAFEAANVMQLVQLDNLKLHIEKGTYSNNYFVQNDEGTEAYLNDVFNVVGEQITTLEEGTSISIKGFGFIIPEGSPYLIYNYPQYELVPLALTVNEPEPEPQPYAFMACEWPAGDPGRISASNVTVDAEQNTITVNQTGDNNVALKFVSTSEYYVTPEQRYFTIRATGLSTAEGKSYLWWLNNANHGSQVAPTTIYKDGDVTVFAWDIRTCGLGDNFSTTENTLLQTTGDWITTFGLTQADAAVPAVISYIGFETTVPEPIVEYEYSFVASEWPAGDPNRTTPDEVTVDDEKNTITVNSTGDNNVALNFKTDKTYYVGPGKQFFVIQATGLSTQAGASKLWWLNAKNNGAEVEPTTIKTKDGLTTLIWDITADATFASGFNFQENSYLDGTGAGTWGWTTTFGLTQQDADVPVVISYIGYDDAESDKVKKMPVYKVNELVEGQVVRTTEGEAELGSTVKVPYRHYNVVEGSLYSKGVTSKEYNYSFTFNTDGQEENITGYTATGKQDIVFLSEGEDIKGLTRVTSGNSAIRSSNSAAAYAAEADVEIVKLPAGTYKLTAAIFDASKNPNSNWFFIAGTDTVARLNCTVVNYQELTSEKFTLDAETSLYLAKGGNGNMGLDLVYIQAVEAVTPVFAYTVNEVAAGQVVRTTTGTADKASSVKIPFRQYNVVDGNLYKKGQINKEFNYSFTLNEDQQVENLEYSATDVTDVVFLSEGEDIEGLTPITTGNTAIRSSNSAAGYAAEADVEFVTLPSGTYKLTAVIYDSSKTPDSHWIFKAGDTEIADLNCTTVNIQELTSDEFTLDTRTALTIAQGGSSTQGIDLIYIVKTADVTDGIATVSTDAARGDNVYDLQGRRVHSMQRSGIYVKNGKKVVKK